MTYVKVQSVDSMTFDEMKKIVKQIAPDAVIDRNHLYLAGDNSLAAGTVNARSPAELMNINRLNSALETVIGVIDTKVDISHPALRNAKITSQDFVPYDLPRPMRHGTAVVSILVGSDDTRYKGLLPGASIYAASVFFEQQEVKRATTTENIARALNWMMDKNVSVVNMSIAGPYNRVLENLIQRISNKGVHIVAAAGNQGPVAKPRYPAAYNSVIAVTAISQSKSIYRLANRGEYIDFAAPGVAIYHAIPDGRYQVSSGTSMATPFVTAAIAASANTQGKIGQDQLDALKRTAEDLGPKGFDQIYGNGLIRPLPK